MTGRLAGGGHGDRRVARPATPAGVPPRPRASRAACAGTASDRGVVRSERGRVGGSGSAGGEGEENPGYGPPQGARRTTSYGAILCAARSPRRDFVHPLPQNRAREHAGPHKIAPPSGSAGRRQHKNQVPQVCKTKVSAARPSKRRRRYSCSEGDSRRRAGPLRTSIP